MSKTPYLLSHAVVFGMFVGLFVFLTVERVRTTPPLVDEYAHVPAGVSHWLTGRFYLYHENPPLIRSLAALPALFSGVAVDFDRASEGNRSEWNVGLDFLKANGFRYKELIERARCVVMLLAVGCAALVFWWTSERSGGVAAAFCAALLLTDPSFVANSAIATIDVGASAFGCLAAYAFWRFLRSPSPAETVLAGVCLGLAQASKFSLLVLYPSFLLLAACQRVGSFLVSRRLGQPDGSGAVPGVAQLLSLFAISLLVLNLLYRFNEFGKPLGTFEFRSQLLSGRASTSPDEFDPGNRLRGTPLAAFPVPMPGQYVLGFDSQKHDEECGFMRMCGGHLVHRGAWYCPVETLLFKLPLGTLVILLLCAGHWVFASRCFGAAAAAPLVSALFLIGMLCSQTGLNWPVRYTLPALPLILVSCGGAIRALWTSTPGRAVLISCLAWNLVALLGSRPFYFSYANELAGGSEPGRRYFLGSNYDWGQDLFRLKAWCDASPDRQPIAICYYGALSAESLGIRTMGLPKSFLRVQEEDPSPTPANEQKPFYWAISWNLLAGLPINITLWDGLQDRAVVESSRLSADRAFARVGYAIFIFRVVPDQQEASPGCLTYRQLRSCLRRATKEERTYSTP